MLIDVSYFTKGARHIQNATVTGMQNADSRAVTTAIEDYIGSLQPRFLRSMVGDKEAGYIEDYLSIVSDTIGEEDTSKYKDVCERLKEPFADYVMFHILRDSIMQKSMKGTFILKGANINVSPIRAQVYSWNSMVDGNMRFLKWAQDGNCPIDIVTETNMLNRINQFNL